MNFALVEPNLIEKIEQMMRGIHMKNAKLDDFKGNKCWGKIKVIIENTTNRIRDD